MLIKYGLGTRFPKECSEWRERKELSAKNRESTVKEEEAKIIENLQSESSRLEIALYYAIADIVLGKFQYVVIVSSFSLTQHPCSQDPHSQ